MLSLLTGSRNTIPVGSEINNQFTLERHSEKYQEEQRLAALRDYGIMDTPPEEDLDAIVRMASDIFGMPISLISLLDEKRQWFKASVGLATKETPRDIAFCDHTIRGRDVFEVRSASHDEQFRNNPLVTGDPHIEFYAGAPLIATDGSRLGTLCVIDTKPRSLSNAQKEILSNLAGMVIKHFELRRKKREVERDRNLFQGIFEQASDIIYTADSAGNFLFVSPAALGITGFSSEELTGRHFTQLVAPDWKNRVNRFYLRQFKENIRETKLEFQICKKDGTLGWVEQNVVINTQPGADFSFQGIVRDVNQRKTAELKLEEATVRIRESQHTLQSIVDNTGAVIFIKDLQLRYSMVNQAFEEVFGQSFGSVQGKTDYDIWPETVARSMQRSDRNAIRKNEALDYEYSMYISDVKRIFLVRVFPLVDVNGLTTGVCSVYTEITSQKKNQELLRERDKRFSKIFHASPAAMLLSSLDPNRLVEVNQSFLKMTGYRQVDLIGRSTSEVGLIGESQRQGYLNMFLEQGSIQNLEVTLRAADGSERVALMSSALVDIDGKDHALSLYYDITERKKVEQALAEAKSQLSEALSIGRIGSFEFRMSDGRVTWSNEIYNILEIDHAKGPLTYDEYVKHIHPDDVTEVLARITECLRDKLPDVTVNRFITAKGKIRWVESRVVPVLDREGDLVAFRGTMQDITERKEVERNLTVAKLLAEKSALAQEQFLANMSHEIRTPINGLVGFTELLQETKLNKTQQEYLNAIRLSGQNLLALINDILDYSKIEAGMLEIEKAPLDLREVMDNIMLLFSHRAQAKNLKLELDFDKQAEGWKLGDAVRLTQILNNLVGNAIKFTQKGFVRISVNVLKDTPAAQQLRIAVRDSGIGIPEAKQSLIFERFSQAANDVARKYGGSGLGLSIARKLVELMHGHIGFTSKAKAGTEFYFEITLEKTGKRTKPETASKAAGTKTLRNQLILLVEDNPFNSQLAKKILTNAGAKVEVSANGKLALRKLKNKKFDVILMDIQMPEMDGHEATRRIRQDLKITTPIIAMTAHALQSEKQKCLEIGMDDYISKPFNAQDLVSTILGIAREAAAEVSGTGVPERLTDLSQLNSIADGDQNFVSQVLHMFVDIIPGELEKMQNCKAKNDLECFRSAAHKLKSPLPLMGLLNLVPVLNVLEAAKDFDSVAAEFEQLQAACTRALAEVREYIEERK